MKSLFFLVMFVMSQTVVAQTIRARYAVSFGIFGQMGTTDAVLETQGDRYTITIDLETVGLAKRLSGDRRELHRSQGRIVKGKLVADTYEAIRTYDHKKIVKRYRFDHRRRRIEKIYEKYRDGKRYDRQTQVLSYYTRDDLLTLYFNLDRYIDKQRPGTYRFKAAGAERQQGEVDVIVPDARQKVRYVRDLGSGAAWYATVIIHQKIFASKEGRLELAVGKDGIAQKALLKDVVLFGDVKAVRVK